MTQIFLFSIYALTTLAATMLTVAEEFPLPTGFSIVLAPLAYVLNEKQRRIRLNVRQANLFGAIGVGLAVLELVGASAFLEAGMQAERRVLAGAHLLSYLTWVSLFQAKEARHYWFLAALGLMQVAVGSILSSTASFGVLFFLYVVLGLWTLSVFSLFQAEQALLKANRERAELAQARTHSQSTALAMQLVHHEPDNFRNSIQIDPNERWVNSRFVAGVSATCVFALFVGFAFFVFIPRVWVGRRPLIVENDDMPIQMLTGHSNEVALGQIGQILESNAKAFEVRFFDAHLSRELGVNAEAERCGYEEPMFRGSVMGRYESGRWTILEESKQWKPLFPPATSERIGSIRQQYNLADPNATTLFGMHPIYFADKARGGSDVGLDLVTAMITRESGRTLGQLSYDIYSRRPRSQPLPRVRDYPTDDADELRESLLKTLTQLPEGLPRLKQLAAEIRATVPDNDSLKVAQAVQSYLRDSGKFAYSLKAGLQDPSMDPVEDFLFNRKEGHCEYYASAMALMLRSLDIPTRLVNGYKGGEENQYSGAFVVEQRHAHAWLEAYVDDDWYTFDPTPASRSDFVREVGTQRGFMARMRETISGLWSQNVVQLSIEQQRSQLYEPIGKRLANSLPNLMRQTTATVNDIIRNPRAWFSTQTFMLTFFWLAVLISVRVSWKRYGLTGGEIRDALWRAIRSLSMSLRERITGQRVEFYERFISSMRRRGFVRERGQTPLEFAQSVEQAASDRHVEPALRRLPTELVDAFYAVRFGAVSPQSLPVSDLLNRLQLFEQAMKASTGHRKT